MPIYEFKCAQCGREFETLVVKAREKINCPDCGFDRCDKLLSSFRSLGGSKGSDDSGGGYASSGSGCGSCSAPSCAGCGTR
ncbi:MAG: zinc ribbon domain-containing protein [Deltaproteobacteria bacterium]|jgi:putative FmdB family regulatory protein|nr:zinc ribbon domain-containing protein [Deltaproteobacteria bacterium]